MQQQQQDRPTAAPLMAAAAAAAAAVARSWWQFDGCIRHPPGRGTAVQCSKQTIKQGRCTICLRSPALQEAQQIKFPASLILQDPATLLQVAQQTVLHHQLQQQQVISQAPARAASSAAAVKSSTGCVQARWLSQQSCRAVL
jgi:hypothetical protein